MYDVWSPSKIEKQVQHGCHYQIKNYRSCNNIFVFWLDHRRSEFSFPFTGLILCVVFCRLFSVWSSFFVSCMCLSENEKRKISSVKLIAVILAFIPLQHFKCSLHNNMSYRHTLMYLLYIKYKTHYYWSAEIKELCVWM